MGPTNDVMAETVLMVVLLFSPVDGKNVFSDSHYSGFFNGIQHHAALARFIT
jgi:hypothetical protein